VSRIRFTNAARNDLGKILDYIAKDNLDAAIKHRQRLGKRWLALIDQPRIGTKRDDLAPDLRSVTEGKYVIFYRIVSDGIQVVRVRHTSQDTKQAFFET
jgi:toxin ParE1/3/4